MEASGITVIVDMMVTTSDGMAVESPESAESSDESPLSTFFDPPRALTPVAPDAGAVWRTLVRFM